MDGGKGRGSAQRSAAHSSSAEAGFAQAASRATPVALWIALVVVVSALPTLAVYRQGLATEGARDYTWVVPPYPQDGLAYLAWVKQAAEGKLLFHVKYTQLEHRAVVFNPPFLVTGWLAALSGWSSGFALFVARCVFVIAFLLVLYRFSGCFGLRRDERWTFLGLVSCSSGLGFLSAAGLKAADRWMPEINTLWSLSWSPIFALGLALMLAILMLVEQATRKGGGSGAGDHSADVGRSFLLAGALTGLLAFVHPYDVVSVGVVVLAVAVYRLGAQQALGPLLRFGLLAGPPCLIQLGLSLMHPVLSAHAARADMPSPALLGYAIGLGLPGLFALFGLARASAEHRVGRLVTIVVWVAAALGLAYAPVWFQRRLVMGIHIPVCLLAAIGVCDLARRASRGRAAVRIALVIGLVATTTPTHYVNYREALESARDDPAAYYVPESLAAALRFLDEHVPSEAVVLAHPHAARLIPGASGNAVTLGHWAQSVGNDQHLRWLRSLFAPGHGLDKVNMLRSSRIDYVFVDASMRRYWLGGETPGWLADVGETVYDRDGVRIVRVER